MTAPISSTSTQSDPSSWGLKEWTAVLHNAAALPVGHPRYAEAQQYRDMALENINTLMQQGNTADRLAAGQLAPGVGGDVAAGVVGFGRGATLGLVKPSKEVRDVIQEAHPISSVIGDVVGTAVPVAAGTALTAGLSPWLAGAAVAGGTGAARGAIDPFLTGDRKMDALIMGVGGAVVGPIVGKGVSLASDVVQTITRNGSKVARIFAQRFAQQAAQTGAKLTGREAVDATEALWRSRLIQLGYKPEDVDRVIAAGRPLWEKSVPRPALAANAQPAPLPKPRPPVPGAPTSLSIPRGEAPRSGQLTPTPGTEGRGFEAMGTRAMPAIPSSQPTLGEMSGVANLQVPRNAGQMVRAAADQAGRPLSDEERDLILQRVLAQRPGGAGKVTPKLSRGAVADVGKQFPYYSRGGQAEQQLTPGPSVSPPNPNFPSQDAIAQKQFALAQQAIQSGDPDAIAAVRALFGNRF